MTAWSLALQVKYGREVVQPVSPWVAVVYSTVESSNHRYLPVKEELRAFFGWLRQGIESTRKPLTLSRDYAMYRFLYPTGLRANELVHLTIRDLRMESSVVHVRAGKGTKGSGPRTRWVPMLYGVDRILRIYLKEIRPKLGPSASSNGPLFLSERGPIGYTTVRNRLAMMLDEAKRGGVDIQAFAPHDFRRAFATHFYEDYPTKVELLKEILGHTSVSTTLCRATRAPAANTTRSSSLPSWVSGSTAFRGREMSDPLAFAAGHGGQGDLDGSAVVRVNPHQGWG